MLATLRQELGLALLFITHNLDLMAQICDRALVLYGGMVMEEAPVGALFSMPRQPYTSALVACVPRLSDVPGRLGMIEGAPPVAARLGPGCPFEPRCSDRIEVCARTADGSARRRPPGGLLDSAPMTALLDVVDVFKVYELKISWLPRLAGRAQSLTAVDAVSVSVPRGGVLGIVGESGRGKSTLARMIMRLETPTAGRIWFAGQDITDLSGPPLTVVRKRMQMVFQDAGGSLNPRKPVRRVLRESLALAGLPRPERDAAAAGLLDRVGLGAAMLEHYPHELSGGQRQRVAITRALAMGPDLIVADEPVSALDVSLQVQIIRLLMRLRDELQLTLVFISHDLALGHHFCDAVAVMKAGKIVERGAPSDVLHHPQHPYTRLLLDAVPGTAQSR